MMKGHLTATSEVGKGSVFHFTTTFGYGKVESCKGNECKLQGKQVLIVDDNETNLRVLERMVLKWDMIPTLGKSIPQMKY